MSQTSKIRVKFVAKGNRIEHAPLWKRQLPGNQSLWKNCQFVFDPECREYDWLVVYDDLSTQGSERFSQRIETLACPARNTIFITAEPSSIKVYGNDFLNQFGIVISSQEPWATPAKGLVLHHQPALRWYYGVPWEWYKNTPSGLRTWDEMEATFPENKTQTISTVTSSKQMTCTEHKTRFDFVQYLKNKIPELDSFGHGIRLVDDKAEALDSYRYHLAIENHYCEHHFTEKLSDAFLGGTLPFYYGCPNAADYFPKDSFIPIDIHNPEESLKIIRKAISNQEYEKRLPAIKEARRRVLHQHNIFPLLHQIINQHHDDSTNTDNQRKIYSRHRMRKLSILHGVRYALDKYRIHRRLQQRNKI